MEAEVEPLFTLAIEDVRRVENLLAQLGAIESELALIFARAMKAGSPIEVLVRPSPERIIGGHVVGSVYVKGSEGCGVYDPEKGVCEPIPCEQVP